MAAFSMAGIHLAFEPLLAGHTPWVPEEGEIDEILMQERVEEVNGDTGANGYVVVLYFDSIEELYIHYGAMIGNVLRVVEKYHPLREEEPV